MTPPTSHHLSLRGLPLRVLEWAPSSAPDPARWPVLLLHGFADTATSWAPVAGALGQAGHRVLAPDLRGFGDSGRAGPGGYYHFPDYIADVDALVRALVPGPLAVVGHSMGGTVATLFAGSRPALVRRLALLEGLGPPDSEPSLAPARFTRWLDDLAHGDGRARERSFAADSALSRLGLQHPQVPRDVLAAQLPHLVREAGPGQSRWHLDPLHRTTSPVPFQAAIYRAFAGAVRCPVLVIDGGPEGFHPPDEAERVAAFADVCTATLPGAGHMMHWTRPEQLTTHLLAFLAPGSS